MVSINELFDLEHTAAAEYLGRFHFPWEALKGIAGMIVEMGNRLDPDEYHCAGKEIWLHKSAVVSESAKISGPCIVGPDTEIRHCAFIRGAALIGRNCVVGNSVELKNVILFDGVQVPHFNYVGDSILGYRAHLGAGAVTSNVKSDKSNVVIHGGKEILTGMKKVGAMVGDYTEIGCNTVLNPGTVLGRNVTVYPGCSVRGVVPANHIWKSGGILVPKG